MNMTGFLEKLDQAKLQGEYSVHCVSGGKLTSALSCSHSNVLLIKLKSNAGVKALINPQESSNGGQLCIKNLIVILSIESLRYLMYI